MIPKFTIAIVLVACLGALVESSHHGGHGYGRRPSRYFDDAYGGFDDDEGDDDDSGRPSNVFIGRFLRNYCKNAKGNYERCQRCVAVGCIRELNTPRDVRVYEECILRHGRCCAKEGVNVENAATGVACYGTGTYDSFVVGELSTAESALGANKKMKDVPS